jgi:predicted MFS family arabinose efflux permease
VIALATFFASWFGGLLWAKVAPSATFYFGATMSFLAFLIFIVGRRKFQL